jgi:ribosome-binding protein aMBF1 (putative translation factor)
MSKPFLQVKVLFNSVGRPSMIRKKSGKQSVGQRMRAGREKMGMSIADLALETGYHPEVLESV